MLSDTFLRQAGLCMLGRIYCADKDSLDRGYREEKLQQVRKLAASR